MGEVVGVRGVQATGEVQQTCGALEGTADDVGEFEVDGLVAVDEVMAEAFQGRGLGGGVCEGGLDLALGLGGGGVALFARLGQLLNGGSDVDLAGVLERLRLGTGVLVRLDFGVVGIDLLVVRVGRVLGRLHALVVELDGFLGLALRPGDGFRVRLQRPGRRVARIGCLCPLGGVHSELLAEGVAGLAFPAGGIDLPHPLVDLVEGAVEVPQMLGALADLSRIAVDEVFRLVGLAELFLARSGAQIGGDAVAPVLHAMGPVVQPDVVQALTQLVRGPVDALAELLLALVPEVLALAQQRVGQVSQSHQP